jgi:hypothetical protein
MNWGHLPRGERVGPTTLATDANSFPALEIGDGALAKSAKKRQKATSNIPIRGRRKRALKSCGPTAQAAADHRVWRAGFRVSRDSGSLAWCVGGRSGRIDVREFVMSLRTNRRAAVVNDSGDIARRQFDLEMPEPFDSQPGLSNAVLIIS